MFKYKISVYMKSGNVIYVRLDAYELKVLRGLRLRRAENEFFDFNHIIDIAQIEGITSKKWWQKWG